jgi:glyoxylate reductase
MTARPEVFVSCIIPDASATVGTRNAIAEICADNPIPGLAGKPLRARVNPEVESSRRK